MSEYYTHLSVCQHIVSKYPDVIFTSDGSGVKLPIGLAKKIKDLKSCTGIPDLLILEPKNGFSGLLIEIKADGRKIFKKNGELLSDKHLEQQFKILKALDNKGYCTAFGEGIEETIRIIDDYMEGRIKKE